MVNTRVAQVSNVSAAATMEQLRTLFGFLGKIEDIRLFPKEDSVLPVTVRICFVRFQDPTSVGMAQHLSNTVFLDKALNVTPFPDGVIPEESRALQMVAASAGGLVSMISNAGTSLLPTPPQPLLGHLPGTISGVAVSTTSAGVMDQTFAALGVPQPPPLTNVDPTKVEEIRRTVYVGNLDSGTVTAEQLLSFFQKVGEVKYVRMAGDETQPTRFAFVEFTEQGSVAKALTYNSVMFAGRPLKINHSNNAIVKPPGKTQEAIQKELAETMKQVRDAQALIQAAIDPEIKAAADKNCTEEPRAPAVQSQIKGRGLVGDNEKKKRSKSRSPARRKSRSRSRRRSRSRSKDARRSRSRRSTSRTRRRSRSPRRRSPPPRRKSRSRSRHRRSRSKSKEHRSRSREKRRRSKTPPKSYRASRRSRSRSREKKEESSSKSRRRSRSPSKHRSRSKSRSGSPKRPSKHRKDKKRDRSKDRDRKEKEGRNSSSSSSSRKRKEKEQTEKEPVEAVEVKKEEKTDKADSKIKRDYDEEEKGFDSQEAAPVVKEEKEEEEEEEPEEEEEEEEVDIVKTEDMDVDSD
ncbi:uncharacterized protein [Apostichopus japonicus]|uniref:uncharacterized protein isoform X2 n=1 Tax=Stichopus japonicus TaxID=307972 RepID=UPI003AB6497D